MFIHWDELQLQAKFFREGFNCWVNTEDDLCFQLPDSIKKFPNDGPTIPFYV